MFDKMLFDNIDMINELIKAFTENPKPTLVPKKYKVSCNQYQIKNKVESYLKYIHYYGCSFMLCGDVLLKCVPGSGSVVVIPNGVRIIYKEAFKGSNLQRCIIPGSVQSIMDEAFGECEELAYLTILDGCLVIGQNAFKGCKSLLSLDLPNSINSIGWGAFEHCKALTSVRLPAYKLTMAYDVFTGCNNLAQITTTSVKILDVNDIIECSGLDSKNIKLIPEENYYDFESIQYLNDNSKPQSIDYTNRAMSTLAPTDSVPPANIIPPTNIEPPADIALTTDTAL